MIGVLDIINEHGIALSFDQVGISNGETGLPVFIAMRDIAETCDTFEKAESYIRKMPPGMPFCLGVSDAKNGKMAVFEREFNDSKVFRRLPVNGILTADNSIWGANHTKHHTVDLVTRGKKSTNPVRNPGTPPPSENHARMQYLQLDLRLPQQLLLSRQRNRPGRRRHFPKVPSLLTSIRLFSSLRIEWIAGACLFRYPASGVLGLVASRPQHPSAGPSALHPSPKFEISAFHFFPALAGQRANRMVRPLHSLLLFSRCNRFPPTRIKGNSVPATWIWRKG